MGTRACHLEDPVGWMFRGRPPERCEDQMFRWGHTQGISTNIHILRRLPRKVGPEFTVE
jgi:hypothetical protein